MDGQTGHVSGRHFKDCRDGTIFGGLLKGKGKCWSIIYFIVFLIHEANTCDWSYDIRPMQHVLTQTTRLTSPFITRPQSLEKWISTWKNIFSHLVRYTAPCLIRVLTLTGQSIAPPLGGRYVRTHVLKNHVQTGWQVRYYGLKRGIQLVGIHVTSKYIRNVDMGHTQTVLPCDGKGWANGEYFS